MIIILCIWVVCTMGFYIVSSSCSLGFTLKYMHSSVHVTQASCLKCIYSDWVYAHTFNKVFDYSPHRFVCMAAMCSWGTWTARRRQRSPLTMKGGCTLGTSGESMKTVFSGSQVESKVSCVGSWLYQFYMCGRKEIPSTQDVKFLCTAIGSKSL